MSRALKILVVLALLAAAAAGALYWWDRSHPPVLPPAPVETKPPPGPGATGPRYPVPGASDKPLPPLGQSDPELREVLAKLFGAVALERFFNVEDFVRRVVATVDNLPRQAYAARLNPVKPAPGLPRTMGRGETLALAPENEARYAPCIQLMEKVDPDLVVAAYGRYYPLFQQAYRELGYPEGHFNDRLVEVIDHLLATPEVKGPIRLAVPHVLYEFADPDLEALSAGQKLLVRMGPENAAKVKAKLRELRARLAGGAAQKP